VIVPEFLRQIVTEITFQARKSPDVNQVSGVSVRMSINNMQSLVSNAEKRAIRFREQVIVPRVSDLEALIATTDGKLELEYGAGEKSQQQVILKLIQKALLNVFDEYMELENLELLVSSFGEGWWVEVADDMSAQDYLGYLSQLRGLRQGIEKLNIGESPGEMAAAIEFILEGLHLHNRLNKEIVDGKVIYNEASKVQPMGRNPEMA
jgi:magnesium chelatase subunit I